MAPKNPTISHCQSRLPLTNIYHTMASCAKATHSMQKPRRHLKSVCAILRIMAERMMLYNLNWVSIICFASAALSRSYVLKFFNEMTLLYLASIPSIAGLCKANRQHMCGNVWSLFRSLLLSILERGLNLRYWSGCHLGTFHSCVIVALDILSDWFSYV